LSDPELEGNINSVLKIFFIEALLIKRYGNFVQSDSKQLKFWTGLTPISGEDFASTDFIGNNEESSRISLEPQSGVPISDHGFFVPHNTVRTV
jgi:hypothetical protein